jgi:hypothetical protein
MINYRINELVDNSPGRQIGEMKHTKEIIKIMSRQHEHTSQCDGPAWLMSERGVVHSWVPFIDGVSLPTTSR